MTAVSANYRELSAAEAKTLAAELADAWKHPLIPLRQYAMAVGPELDRLRDRELCEPFATLVRCLQHLPADLNHGDTGLLDIGASAGYYSEVLKLCGYHYRYRGSDFSPAFQELAYCLYPEIRFDVADARQLPYADDEFDIVLTGAVMMHCIDYVKVLAEAVRVAKQYVILHRTPVFTDRPTSYFVKEAYGFQCLEIHFNEAELFELFEKDGLAMIWQDQVFFADGFGHRDYLLEKKN